VEYEPDKTAINIGFVERISNEIFTLEDRNSLETENDIIQYEFRRKNAGDIVKEHVISLISDTDSSRLTPLGGVLPARASGKFIIIESGEEEIDTRHGSLPSFLVANNGNSYVVSRYFCIGLRMDKPLYIPV